jgi:hypothetical protein
MGGGEKKPFEVRRHLKHTVVVPPKEASLRKEGRKDRREIGRKDGRKDGRRGNRGLGRSAKGRVSAEAPRDRTERGMRDGTQKRGEGKPCRRNNRTGNSSCNRGDASTYTPGGVSVFCFSALLIFLLSHNNPTASEWEHFFSADSRESVRFLGPLLPSFLSPCLPSCLPIINSPFPFRLSSFFFGTQGLAFPSFPLASLSFYVHKYGVFIITIAGMQERGYAVHRPTFRSGGLPSSLPLWTNKAGVYCWGGRERDPVKGEILCEWEVETLHTRGLPCY